MILATTNGVAKELIPAGNYIARCYQMLEIGTVEEAYQGEAKTQKKVRIGWELPTELRVFNTEKGEQPMVISQEYTLSMHEKSNLRKTLASWRGKDFTEGEAKSFDITKLLGAACMLNIIHRPGKTDPSKMYQAISSISAMPKGVTAPKAINKPVILSYDGWDEELFNILPDFIRDKMKGSQEYKQMQHPESVQMHQELIDDGLPF